jgi:hypothetical protein
MRIAGIEGARRTKRVKTTRPDPTAGRHPDLDNREFTADAPNNGSLSSSQGTRASEPTQGPTHAQASGAVGEPRTYVATVSGDDNTAGTS